MNITYKDLIAGLSDTKLMETWIQTKKVLETEIEIFQSPLGIRSFAERVAVIQEEIDRRKENE